MVALRRPSLDWQAPLAPALVEAEVDLTPYVNTSAFRVSPGHQHGAPSTVPLQNGLRQGRRAAAVRCAGFCLTGRRQSPTPRPCPAPLAPAQVQDSLSLERAYILFRSMGLRHLVVVDEHNHVQVGACRFGRWGLCC